MNEALIGKLVSYINDMELGVVGLTNAKTTTILDILNTKDRT